MNINKNNICNCGWCGKPPSLLFSDNQRLTQLWKEEMFGARIWCTNPECDLRPTTGFVVYYKKKQDEIIEDTIKEWNEINSLK